MKISPVVLDRVPEKLDKFGNDQNTFFNIHDQSIDTIDFKSAMETFQLITTNIMT